uniref:Uncharacterized protein n=1 Tax=Cacopsylla melanoneura TaxID=428564 RepID=A0A8D8RIS8_9HEMI
MHFEWSEAIVWSGSRRWYTLVPVKISHYFPSFCINFPPLRSLPVYLEHLCRLMRYSKLLSIILLHGCVPLSIHSPRTRLKTKTPTPTFPLPISKSSSLTLYPATYTFQPNIILLHIVLSYSLLLIPFSSISYSVFSFLSLSLIYLSTLLSLVNFVKFYLFL